MDTRLTKSEREIMKLLWEVGEPLTGREIIEKSDNRTWKKSYVHLLINSLLDKELIIVDGFKKNSKNYSRTFAPSMTEEEFRIMQVTDEDTLTDANIEPLVLALVEKIDDKNVIERIQKIIEEKKKAL